MSVLFLIAGLTTMYSLKKRTIGQYYIERFKRLLVPFGDGNILTVYKHFFTTCKDGFYGYDGGFTPAHLWFLHISKKIQWSPVRNWDFQQSLYGIYAYENGYYERMDMAIRMHAIVMVSSLYSNGIWCNRYGAKISESDKSSDVVVIEPLVRNLLHSHACTDCNRVFCDAVCTNIYVRSDLHNDKRIRCCYDIAG